MANIKPLPAEEIKKIAAGEVVERPATVVKELIENALDAGAKFVQLYVRDGGRSFLRIVDDGHGMAHDDAHLACAPHATSKIVSVDDLQTLTTFGFRGEALSSISAVSTFTLITRDAARETGTKLVFAHGVLAGEETVSCQVGTDITIEGLFDNVPARKKFLKTAETELRVIQTLVQSFILAHQHVHFKVFNHDTLLYNCPPVQKPELRFAQLWDSYLAQNLVEIAGQDKTAGVSISGLVSRVQQLRYNTAHIFLLVNKRWIKNIGLVRSVLKGYSGALPQGRYPIAALFITIDPALVDVNIHPRKEEVKFVQEYKIEQLVQESVKKALERDVTQRVGSASSHAQQSQPWAFSRPASYAQKPMVEPIFTPGRIIPEDELFTASPRSGEISESEATRAGISSSAQIWASTEQIPLGLSRSYRLIGQCHKTYLILEKEEELIFVDQHAAHERILYEHIINNRAQAQSIALLFPQTVTMSATVLELLMRQRALLAQHGIIADSMGSDRLVIKEVPVYLKHINLNELVQELITFLQDCDTADNNFLAGFQERLCVQMACKAAVKAGDELSTEKMYEILDKLQTVDNRLTCPHGRPTVWTMGIGELEKKFRRDYKK